MALETGNDDRLTDIPEDAADMVPDDLTGVARLEKTETEVGETMLQNLFTVATQVGTLFLLMAVGYVLAKAGKLTADVLPKLSFLLMYVVTPCVVIDTMQLEHGDEVLSDLGLGALLALASYILYILGSQFFFRRQEPDTRDTLRFSMVYGNTGFMGFPLIRSVLGREAMLFAMPAYLMFQLLSWTHGAALMGGREQISLKKLALNPAVIGITAGLILFLGRLSLPSMVGDAVGYLADLNTPLAMVVIGGQMASADLLSTFRNKVLYVSAAVKLVGGPLVTALVLFPFRLPPLLFCATVILAGTPTAGSTGMFAEQFRRDRRTAAQSITLSTLLSILTLPVVAVAANTLTTLY